MTPILKSESRPQAKQANVWLVTSIILVLILAGVVGFMAYEKMGNNTASKGMTVLSADEAAQSLIDFINEVYGERVGQVTLKATADKNGLYEVTLGITENGTPSDQVVYVTKDGKIFIPQIIDIATMREQYQAYLQEQAAQPAAPTDTEPAVDDNLEPTPAPVE